MARVWNRAGDPRHQWRSVVLADRPSGRAAVARWRRDRSPAGAARRRRPLISPVFLTVSSRGPPSIPRESREVSDGSVASAPLICFALTCPAGERRGGWLGRARLEGLERGGE